MKTKRLKKSRAAGNVFLERKRIKGMAKKAPSVSQMAPSLIGVIHLPPLPGSPNAPFDSTAAEIIEKVGERAIREALTLQKAGFHGVILENFGDAPFYSRRTPVETVAAMSILAGAVREACKDLLVGVNVLRNDAHSALAIAAVSGCDLIRVNVLSGVAATDQGWIEGEAATLMRERARLKAEVAVMADVHVKHAQSLSSPDLELAIEETILRAGADAVILTGSTTGRSVNIEALQKASFLTRKLKVPLLVGSGLDADNFSTIAPLVDGVIVSSALRKGGQAGEPLDNRRITRFMKAFAELSAAPEKKVKRKAASKKPSRKKKSST
jgi:uncharacterized protein